MSAFHYVVAGGAGRKLRRFVASGVCAIVLAASGVAQAQPQTPKPATTTTTTTSEYVEQNVGGDQVVKFTGDELPATGPSYYGDVVRRPPGVMRAGLIRPRLNFVPELLKSVENL
jgi:hypothetical protein